MGRMSIDVFSHIQIFRVYHTQIIGSEFNWFSYPILYPNHLSLFEIKLEFFHSHVEQYSNS